MQTHCISKRDFLDLQLPKFSSNPAYLQLSVDRWRELLL